MYKKKLKISKTNKDSQPASATNTLVNLIKELKNPIEEKFVNVIQKITSVQNNVSSQFVNIGNSITAVEKSVIQAIKQGECNAQNEKTQKITSHTFDID